PNGTNDWSQFGPAGGAIVLLSSNPSCAVTRTNPNAHTIHDSIPTRTSPNGCTVLCGRCGYGIAVGLEILRSCPERFRDSTCAVGASGRGGTLRRERRPDGSDREGPRHGSEDHCAKSEASPGRRTLPRSAITGGCSRQVRLPDPCRRA